MVYIGMLSLGSGLAYILPILGMLLYLVVWFMFFRYAMTILVQTSRGNFDPDAADVHLESGDRRPLKQVGYVFIMVILVGVIAATIGPKLAMLAGLLMTISLPAAIIIIAIEDSLASALNPLQIFWVISKIGLPYFLLSLFLLLLQGGDAIVISLLGPMIPDIVEYPAITFVSMYFLLVMYHMMGYVVYQYHEALGFHIDKTFAENTVKSADDAKMSDADRKIAARLTDGDIQGAIDELVDDMRYERNDIAKNQKLHKLYLTLGRDEKTLEHGQRLLGLLVGVGQSDAAYELMLKLKALSADFAVSDAAWLLPLAETAKRRNNAALSLGLINGFDKKYPKHGDIPKVYLLAAKILADVKQDDVQAVRILETIILRYPDSSTAAEAKTYISVLQSTRKAMAAPKPG